MYLKHTETTVNDEGWQSEWPQEPNTAWWFVGWRFGKDWDCKPEVALVWVVGLADNISYIAEGNFLYKSEGAIGVFKKALVEIPSLFGVTNEAF
jgi:hypothetical protein